MCQMKSNMSVVITVLLFLAVVHGYDKVGERETQQQQQRNSQSLRESDIRFLKHLENTVGEYNTEIASSMVSFMVLRLIEGAAT